ncbi:MAG: hypothetical protein JSV54_04125 [Chloroflexota bacterium]|nr:MAG: hypothetical protein JSV54_04125 [Chloroflexota bacterium]
MEKERIIIGEPVAIARTTVVPVVKLSFNCQPSCGSIFFSGVKKPVSIVVASQSSKKAFDINGNEIPLDQLIQEVPDLVRMLERT